MMDKQQLIDMPTVTVEQVIRFRLDALAHISALNIKIAELEHLLDIPKGG